MKNAKSVSLGMFGAWLAAFVIAGGMSWSLMTMPRQHTPTSPPTPDYMAQLEAAQSCEQIKLLCTTAVSGYDIQKHHIAFLNRTIDDLFSHMIKAFVGAGLISMAAFFYLYWAIRAAERRGNVAT